MYKFIIVAAFVLPFSVLAQKNKSYNPLKTEGNIPKQVYVNPLITAKEAIKNETLLTGSTSKRFHNGVSTSIWNILNSGKVYFDGPVTDYLKTILKKILADKPDIYNQIKIYAYKSSSINAVCYPDGHIFVNIGLINAVESEDELAFIIAHEVVHFAKNHAKQTIIKGTSISEAEEGIQNRGADIYRYLKYSRENEQESDASALNIIINTDYNAAVAHNSLRNLERNDSLAFKPDFKKYFENSLFTVDTTWIGQVALENWLDKVKRKRGQKGDDDDDDEENVLVDEDEDIYQTHPDIEKRILAVDEILKAREYKDKGIKSNHTKFIEIQQLCKHEAIYNLYLGNNYSLSFYYGIKNFETDTTDVFYKMYMIKSLYMLCHLRSISELEKSMKEYGESGESGINETHAFLNQLTISDLKKMAYGYMKAHAEQMTGIEDFAFYQALLTDNYLGKEAATAYYKQYSDKYPDGKYIAIVKNKLKSIL